MISNFPSRFRNLLDNFFQPAECGTVATLRTRWLLAKGRCHHEMQKTMKLRKEIYNENSHSHSWQRKENAAHREDRWQSRSQEAD